MLRGFFVLWISLVGYMWAYHGFLPLIASLFILHVIVLRVIPKVLFDYDFMNTANIASIAAHEGFTRNCPYYGCGLTIEGLTEDDFRKWLKDVVSKRPDLNRTIARFGPETFALYYFAPGLSVDEIGTVVPEVVTQADYDNFVEDTMSKQKHKLGGSTWLVFFFPNYEGEEMIFTMHHHTMYDGAAGRQMLCELMDNRCGMGQRNYLKELQSDILYTVKAIMNIPNIYKLYKSVNDCHWPKGSLIRAETESAMETATFKRCVIKGLDKHETLKRCRAHKITLNDLMVAAKVAAYHKIHAKRGIEIDRLPVTFNINMRFYPFPYRLGNEISIFMRYLPCKAASLELINDVKDSMMSFKKDNREAFIQYFINFQVNVLSHEMMVKLNRKNGTKCLISSNVPGPEDGWTFMGKPVKNIWTEGINKSDLIHVATCGKNMNITLSYSTGKEDQEIYKEYHQEIVNCYHELMALLE